MQARPSSRQAGRLQALVTVLLAITMIAGIGVYLASMPQPSPLRATVLDAPLALPEFTLTAGDGSGFTRASFEGHWSLLFFGFTHCPDICPATLQQLSLARRRMADDGADTLPDIVFVSVDPERDTMTAVAAYAGAFGDGVTGVTGSLDEIDKLTGALGIYHARTPDGSGAYQVEHSAAVLLVNEDAGLGALFSAPHDVESLARDTVLIMDSR